VKKIAMEPFDPDSRRSVVGFIAFGHDLPRHRAGAEIRAPSRDR
jgi:hypothetical protein